MQTLKAQPLTAQAFAPYGACILPGELGRPGENGFFPDALFLNLGQTAPLTAGFARVAGTRRVVTMLEYHKFTSECILPLNGDCLLFVHRPVPGRPFPTEDMQAFWVPRNTLVRLNPGVVHGNQFSTDGTPVDVLLLLPAFAFGNDTEVKFLPEDEQFLVEG